MRKFGCRMAIGCVPLLAGALLLDRGFAQTSAPQASDFWCPAQGIAYGVSLRPSEHLVHVDAVTRQPADEFQLPVWNALYQVRNFAVNVNHVIAYEGVPQWMCDGCETREASATKRDKTTWAVSTSGKHPCVTFSYDVTANDPGPYGASLDAQHGFFNWAEILVYRPGQQGAPVSLRIFNLPVGWKGRGGGVFAGRAEDLAEDTSPQHANNSDGPVTAESYGHLVDSPVMLGKLYERSFQQDGTTYRVVTDSPEIDLAALEAMLRKITAAAVDWMQEAPGGQYTFLFPAASGSGGGGMEHADSCVVDIGHEALKKNVMNASDYTAHEFFHLWNVKRIRPRSLEPVDYTREQYSRVLWFSEGVTSTVANIFLMRAGLSDEQHSLSHLAALITAVQARSARRTQSAEEASLDTWFDGYSAYRRAERSISYYAKGELLGFLIDLEMRRLTQGRRCLRDLFQYMDQHYGRTGTYFDDSEGVRLALQELTGNDFRDFFSRYVSGVEEVPYDQFFAYIGLALHHRQVAQVYTGFTAANAPGQPPTITLVDEDSAAARLKLQRGDVVLSVNGRAPSGDWNQFLQKQNPRGRLRLKIKSARGEILSVDLPFSTQKIDEYQFFERPGATAAERERRTAFLRGEAEHGQAESRKTENAGS